MAASKPKPTKFETYVARMRPQRGSNDPKITDASCCYNTDVSPPPPMDITARHNGRRIRI